HSWTSNYPRHSDYIALLSLKLWIRTCRRCFTVNSCCPTYEKHRLPTSCRECLQWLFILACRIIRISSFISCYTGPFFRRCHGNNSCNRNDFQSCYHCYRRIFIAHVTTTQLVVVQVTRSVTNKASHFGK